jgi:AraC-like DNA-binding protein
MSTSVRSLQRGLAHAGSSDPAHFTHFFRRLAGVTPREYRAALPEA